MGWVKELKPGDGFRGAWTGTMICQHPGFFLLSAAGLSMISLVFLIRFLMFHGLH